MIGRAFENKGQNTVILKLGFISPKECNTEFVQHNGGLLQRLPATYLLSKVVMTYIVTPTYMESAISDNWVFHESDQPGQEETDCIPLMKAGSQKNLDQKKNIYTCNLFQNTSTFYLPF